jgi:acyl-CoA synthetase (AMP-forming)/AMP-acid ligase II
MYLTQLLHRNLQRRPDREALVCGGTRRTYAQLHDRVARLAGHLKQLGVKRGDRVAVLSLSSVECVEIMLAAWWIGAIFCPVNTRWSGREIAESFDDCTPEVLFVDGPHAALAGSVGERVTCLRHLLQLAPDGDARASAGSYPALLATAVAVADEPEFAPQRLRSVKRLHYGAAPSAGALLQRAARTLPWAGLYQAYGMTESMGVGTVSFPSDHRSEDWASGHALSAGQACLVAELRVVDIDGNDAGVGEVGEIVLRGPNVSPGNWNRPEETAQTFRDGWLHTGDAGKLDAQGYLYVVDRIKDMIVTGGENVYSSEVENALAQHPAVATSAVIGIPSDKWGEAVHAVVVLRPGVTVNEAALKDHCRNLVAHYKAPKSVEFVAALPLTAAGKVGKNVLRERYWKGFARRVN